MKIDVTTVLKQLSGEPIKDPDNNDREVDLKIICTRALTVYQNADETGEQKFKDYQLATRIHDAEKEIEITPEECVLLREKIGRHFTTLIVGQAFKLLE